MDNRQFGRELERRTRLFAVRIIRLSAKIPGTPEGRVVRYQLTKSGTSIGANYREANRAVSHADFSNKIGICTKEASETAFWLEVTEEAGLLAPQLVQPEYEECGELLAIFTAIGRSSERGK